MTTKVATCYLCNLGKDFEKSGTCDCPGLSDVPALISLFSLDYCRWAVSSVMTRQNQSPTEDGSRVTLALIPLWDMCNHTSGLITTGYNLEDDRCECVALQDFRAGEQVGSTRDPQLTLCEICV